MGRPKCIFEVNVKNPEKCLDELISICEDDDEMKTNLNMMGKSIIARTTNTSTGSSQTEIGIDSLVTMTEQLNSLCRARGLEMSWRLSSQLGNATHSVDSR